MSTNVIARSQARIEAQAPGNIQANIQAKIQNKAIRSAERQADMWRRFWLSSLLLAITAACLLLLAGRAEARGPVSVAPIAELLVDAVVNISTSQSVKGPGGKPLPRVPDGSPFEDLFEDFFKKRKGKGSQPRKVSSLGSGFVIDGKEGLIVTNNHVIEGADEISVVFRDGRKLKVIKVLGTDTKTDLALLKVAPKKPLKDVKFGSSEKLRVGDWVMAVGNPFGLGGSVSVGIISAKQRDIQSGPYDNYLQTDAAINKGNSGGPLFNMEGEVIGVNTAIISPTGGSIGIGFSVPSDVAMVVLDQLKRFGETRRGWLGVNIQSVSEDIAPSLKVEPGRGALVASVAPGGPAAKAGIKPGDVIVKFAGKVVRSVRALPRIVAQTAHGSTVAVEIARKGKREVINVLVGRLDEDNKGKKSKSSDSGLKTDQKSLLGLKVEPLTDALRKKYKYGADAKGLVITDVATPSPASTKGVKIGQLIIEAAQEPVREAKDIARAIAASRKSGRRAVLLRIEDDAGKLRFVAVPLPGTQ
ncbi:MAG: serine protease Do [Hyphomicrobiaceae bacterium]|jgi:serine protease Do